MYLVVQPPQLPSAEETWALRNLVQKSRDAERANSGEDECLVAAYENVESLASPWLFGISRHFVRDCPDRRTHYAPTQAGERRVQKLASLLA